MDKNTSIIASILVATTILSGMVQSEAFDGSGASLAASGLAYLIQLSQKWIIQAL